MTKAAALALMNALEGQKVAASASMDFDGAGVESWSVQLDSSLTYTGAQLSQLTAYCATNQLTLTCVFSRIGVI